MRVFRTLTGPERVLDSIRVEIFGETLELPARLNEPQLTFALRVTRRNTPAHNVFVPPARSETVVSVQGLMAVAAVIVS